MHHDDTQRLPWAYRTLVQVGAHRPDGGAMVVGVNGSPEAINATRWAADLASRLASEVILVHAEPIRSQLATDLPTLGFSSWRQHLETSLRTEWSAPLRQSGVDHRVILAERPVACALLAVAWRERASSIVLGTRVRVHGPRLGGRLVTSLVHQADCPVICVPCLVDEEVPAQASP